MQHSPTKAIRQSQAISFFSYTIRARSPRNRLHITLVYRQNSATGKPQARAWGTWEITAPSSSRSRYFLRLWV